MHGVANDAKIAAQFGHALDRALLHHCMHAAPHQAPHRTRDAKHHSDTAPPACHRPHLLPHPPPRHRTTPHRDAIHHRGADVYSTYMGWIWVTEPRLLAVGADGVLVVCAAHRHRTARLPPPNARPPPPTAHRPT